MNSVLQIQSDNLNLPLSLFISVASDAVDQQANLSKNILKFYNLVDLNRVNQQSSANRIESQTKRILDYLNCIRFCQPMLGRQSSLPNQTYMQQPQHHQHLIDSKTKIPSFSFILITNNSNTSGNTNICNTNPSNKLGLSEEDYLNSDLKNLWSYHHKVELNDPVTGKPIARQLFFRLNTFSNFEMPLLFSKSNWHSPMACNTSNEQQQQSASSVKYIVRLNINCKNFEMMLFFYRMLFNKCANHSKKHFSLFVLKTIRENDSNNNKCEFEYQLSLKYHDTSSVSIVNANSNGSVNEDHLIYKIDDRTNFEHICRLLSGYTTELIKDKVYAVQDPDGNQIYLVDSTTSVMNCSSKISTSTASSLFCSIGISERYFNSLKLNNYSIWLPQSNLKVMNTNSSSSSFHSADSGNYSTLSSSSSSSNVVKCAHYSNNIGKNINIKSNEVVMSAGLPTPQNVPVYHSSKSNRLAKSLREYQEFMRHYKKLHKLISKEQICLQNEEAKIKFGVKDLIQRFNCNKDSMSETSSGGSSSSSAAKNKSCENIKNIAKTSASDEYELKDLMRKATLNPIDLIHFKNKEVDVERQINAINNCRNMKGRSLSVMAEPYRNRKNNSFSSSTLSSSILSSSSSSSLSTLSSMSSDSINIKLKVFDRQKSKSVTFIDSNIKQNEKLKHKKLRNKQALNTKSAVQQRERSKSTIPFSELEHRYDFYNSNCYLTADVDNESEYYTINEPNSQQYERQLANTNRLPAKHINYLSNEFNLIAFKSNKNNSNHTIMNTNVNKNVLSNRPQVGVTPETRFRRAPTLDIIRSTKMPVQQTNENNFSCNQQKFFFNNLHFKTKPKQAIAKF